MMAGIRLARNGIKFGFSSLVLLIMKKQRCNGAGGKILRMVFNVVKSGQL